MKKKAKVGTKTAVSVQFENADLVKIEELGKAQGKPRAAVIRTAALEYLETHGK